LDDRRGYYRTPTTSNLVPSQTETMASTERIENNDVRMNSSSSPTIFSEKPRTTDPVASPSTQKEPEEEERRLSRDESISTESIFPNQEDQDQNPDLEANPVSLAPTPSGPPHSAFSPRKRKFIVFMAAFAGFFSPLSANIYFPALNTLSKDLNVSSSLINLTLTSYMIFQGLAPTFFGDLADMAGRRPAYLIGFVIYIAACIGIACQNSYAALFILRCMQSTGSSSTIALASGVIADVSTSAERGMYMGLVTLGPMVGPAIGPVLGGVLAQFLGWRSIFWFLAILAGVFMIPFVLAFPETARNVVGDGSIPPQGWNMTLLNWLAVRKTEKASKGNTELERTNTRSSQKAAQAALFSKRKLRWPNPLSTLRVIFEKDVGLLLFYNSIIYTAFYDVTASSPYLLAQIYHFNDLQIGLAFLPFGFGCLIAPLINGRLMDWNYRRVAKNCGFKIDRKRGDILTGAFPLEKARFQVAAPMLVVGDAAVLAYGWVMQAETSLAVPLILQFVIGLCLNGGFQAMSVVLVDMYPQQPSTSTAANNLCRCLMGAAGTAIIIQMIDAMGRGWCFTFVAGVVALFSPILWILVRWGPKWRDERRAREGLKLNREEEKMEVERNTLDAGLEKR
jgi:multidrug resistance protein